MRKLIDFIIPNDSGLNSLWITVSIDSSYLIYFLMKHFWWSKERAKAADHKWLAGQTTAIPLGRRNEWFCLVEGDEETDGQVDDGELSGAETRRRPGRHQGGGRGATQLAAGPSPGAEADHQNERRRRRHQNSNHRPSSSCGCVGGCGGGGCTADRCHQAGA